MRCAKPASGNTSSTRTTPPITGTARRILPARSDFSRSAQLRGSGSCKLQRTPRVLASAAKDFRSTVAPRYRASVSLQRLACYLAGGLVWLYAAPSYAASLRWSAPAECPPQSGVEAQIERSIGRPLREVYGVDFEVAIEKVAARKWLLQLRTQARTLSGDVRERELSGQSCGEVSDAATLAITLTISERAATRNTTGTEATLSDTSGIGENDTDTQVDTPAERPAETDASQTEAGEAEPPPSASAPIPLEFSVSAALVLDTAELPSLGAGGTAEIAMRYGVFKLIALGALFAEQETRLGDGRGGRFGLALFGGLLCLQPSAEAVLMLGCAGFELGTVSAEGILNEPLRGSAPLRAVRVELGGGYRFSPRWAAFLRLGVSAPLTSVSFSVDDGDRVHRLGPVSGRAIAGIELFL